jgi:peptidoglycan/xylan/chitin deacetylase (PgdA/CDA1 family)
MKKLIVLLIIFIVLIAGCSYLVGIGTEDNEIGQGMEQEGNPSGNSDEETTETDLKSTIDINVEPNESGKIMVLMYHNIGGEEEEWVRTPENFRKDLSILYEKGYRPISLKEYVSGNITTEQGLTPIVITFDDGNLNNFQYLEDGTIDQESAVGILLNFHELHKDFPLEATFFLDGKQPFRQNNLIHQKLDFLIEAGMDIGNHTLDHISFKSISKEEIQEQIGAQAQFLYEILNIDDYYINTLALPFGERPKDEELKTYLAKGVYQGISYDNIAILNVGWNPGFSPYDKKFDPGSIPRVRASEINVDNVGFYNYLDYFDRNPGEKFISDGVAEVITVPKEKIELLNTDGSREIYGY